MATTFLTVDQIMEYHTMALEVGGGLQGVRTAHQLASAVYQPQQTFGGEELYPTVAEKAAAYGFFLAESQAFFEGNKRTASIAMLAFLDLNGYEFHQTDEEIENMFVDLGNHVIDQGNFFGWVCNHASPAPAAPPS